MSIFPKRALAGNAVTIHWNFNTSKLAGRHICPLVRIGVKDPSGQVTMLFEKHVLALPAVDMPSPLPDDIKPVYLNKNAPLLLISTYLSGKYTREKLADILENIQAGRHYYFVFNIPADAPLGKYTLISEVISEGEIRSSNTAADDFFYVEKVEISHIKYNNDMGAATLRNCSSEPTPIKIIEYSTPGRLSPSDIQTFELPGFEVREVKFHSKRTFLSYNEEREIIPLYTENSLVTKNPYFINLKKEEEDSTYVLHHNSDDAFILEKENQYIWNSADGIHSRDDLRIGSLVERYDEMVSNGLLYELYPDGKKAN